jgi:hypothetical protein
VATREGEANEFRRAILDVVPAGNVIEDKEDLVLISM